MRKNGVNAGILAALKHASTGKLQVDFPTYIQGGTLTGPCSLGPEQYVFIPLVGDSDASSRQNFALWLKDVNFLISFRRANPEPLCHLNALKNESNNFRAICFIYFSEVFIPQVLLRCSI